MSPERKVFWSRVALGLALAAGWLQLALVGPDLPERVVSHFDWRGRVDGWTNPEAFVITFALLEAFLAAVFLVVGAAARGLPREPQAERRRTPEREAAVRAALSGELASLGVLTLGMLLFCVQVCARASHRAAALGSDESAAAIHVSLVVYALAVAVWVRRLVGRHEREAAGGL